MNKPSNNLIASDAETAQRSGYPLQGLVKLRPYSHRARAAALLAAEISVGDLRGRHASHRYVFDGLPQSRQRPAATRAARIRAMDCDCLLMRDEDDALAYDRAGIPALDGAIDIHSFRRLMNRLQFVTARTAFDCETERTADAVRAVRRLAANRKHQRAGRACAGQPLADDAGVVWDDSLTVQIIANLVRFGHATPHQFRPRFQAGGNNGGVVSGGDVSGPIRGEAVVILHFVFCRRLLRGAALNTIKITDLGEESTPICINLQLFLGAKIANEIKQFNK